MQIILLVFRMALFADSHYVNFHGFIANKNHQMCTVVRDPKTCQVLASENSHGTESPQGS